MEEASENISFIASEYVVVSPTVGHAGKPGWDRTAFGRQLFAASGAIIGSISFGMTTGFSGTLFHQLDSSDTFRFNTDYESWIGEFLVVGLRLNDGVLFSAGSVVLSMLCGVVLSGCFMRLFGRKPTQVGLYLPWICGWICMASSSNIWNLLPGCILTGLGAGGHCAVSSIYTAEVTEPKFRGLICIQISLGVSFGILLSHVLGILLPWRIAIGIAFVVPTIAFLLVLFAPESPTWLLLTERTETARKIFFHLRNNSTESENEINAMIRKASEYDNEWKKNIRSRSFLKPFFVLSLMFTVQQGSGLNVIVFYAKKIMSSISGDVNTESYVVVVDTVRLLATLIACGLVKVTGRRKLYFWTAIGVLMSLSGMIVTLMWTLSNVALVVFMCSYIWFLYIGFSPLPWVMVGEMYPANLKEVGGCANNIFSFVVMFATVKSAPFIIETFGMTVMFDIYLIVIVAGVTVLYFCMPETNNITLQQVEENMKK